MDKYDNSTGHNLQAGILIPGLHEGDELVGHLCEYLPGEVEPGQVRVEPRLGKVVEGHELHDVAGSRLAHRVRQAHGVPVQLL